MNPNLLPVDDSLPYHDALAQCIDHWGLVPEKTELVRDGVNHVFATEFENGAPVIIRISDGALRGRDEILGELLWLDHLIRQGCTVTTPIPSRGGDLLETIELEAGTMHVSCFERFGGRQLDPATDAEWNDELFLKLGREIGRIHRASDKLQLPADHDRRPWYESKLTQFPDPLPETFNPQVVDTMRAFIDELRRRPTPPRHYGLVHRDLHEGNFLVEDGKVEIIDFDLGCYGWRTMDLAVLLFSSYYYPSLRVPHASELAGHVLAMVVQGYRDEYTLDGEQLDTVGDMILLHTILNYIVMVPAVEHWQIVLGDPQPTVTESLAWIEQLWLGGHELQVDLSQLQPGEKCCDVSVGLSRGHFTQLFRAETNTSPAVWSKRHEQKRLMQCWNHQTGKPIIGLFESQDCDLTESAIVIYNRHQNRTDSNRKLGKPDVNSNHSPLSDSSPYHDVLAQCIDHWGLVPEKTELVRDGINHVFATEFVDGAPVIIRISDGALRGRGEILGELLWLDHLIRHGCTVTTPIPSRGGELLETIELDAGTMHVSCFERFGGRQLDPATDAEWNDELFLKLGREIGRIHCASDKLQLPADRDRRPWYESKSMQFPDSPPAVYNPQVVDAMRAFINKLREWPTPSRHYGLVHRDLHKGNFLVENGKVQIIDFDLGCYGWRAVDLAVLLFSSYYYPSLRVPHASELAGNVLAKVVQGYREEYTLDGEQLDMVGDMILLHTIHNYIVIAPAEEHWQIALGDPQPTVTESLAWIEQLWLGGHELQVDLSQL